MSEVQFKIGENGSGVFFIEGNGERIAHMVIRVSGATLTAMHTEVLPAWREHKLGHKLVDAMVDYARKNNLKVVPLCPFTRATFERHPEQFADVWEKS